jgi:hypothetical protein
MGNATIPLNRRATTSKAGFVRWAILVIHLFSSKGSKKPWFDGARGREKSAHNAIMTSRHAVAVPLIVRVIENRLASQNRWFIDATENGLS